MWGINDQSWSQGTIQSKSVDHEETKKNNLIKLINKILLWFPAGTWLELIQVIQQSVLLQ